LMDQDGLSDNSCLYLLRLAARNVAGDYAALNKVTSQSPTLAWCDVQVGNIANPFDPDSPFFVNYALTPNAVQVRVQRSSDQNGRVPLFFARILGMDDCALEAQATAALIANFRGFQTPSSGENLGILPFALDEDTWLDLLDGNGQDSWTWDSDSGEVVSGGDGILEVNLFPQGTGSPGNRGTVDIGSNNNSTADLARQILYGVTPEDLAYHGGTIELDENGELFLNGDTGISAGMKDELASIKGQPRTIPLFREVNGNGNNATYTIVGFAGIRITNVRLTGKMSKKEVVIQPAIHMIGGGIPSTTGGQTSSFVYSPVWLVR
ncbi:MAG: hypothetical protein HQ582_07605, partial [Planctomycetes bacterium]|nr:hypothetical protein [Planctomycetota bacterium]